MTPERKLKKAICAYLDSIGAYHFSPVQTGRGKAGLDIYVCYLGRFIGIEAKVLPRLATLRQSAAIHEINRAHGFAFVAYDVATVREHMEYLEKGYYE